MAGMLAGFERPGGESQPSLMLDDIDEQASLFAGPVRHVADIMDGPRGRGRPKGSQNRSSWRDTMLRMGYRHPGENLLAIANADPHALAKELSDGTKDGWVTPSDAMALILKANAELMPYFESKRATEIAITESKLGVMIIGDMRSDRGPDAAFMDVAGIEKPE